MIRLSIIPLALILSGCDLYAFEGKESPYKADQERRQALTTPEPSVLVEEPPKAPCVAVFRVMTCDENGNEVWL